MSFGARYIPQDPHQRQAERNARNAAVAEEVRRAKKPSITMGGCTTSAAPKSPADRLQAFRDLAMGEACQVALREVCRRDPDYTVLAHTNTQADQKGTGYKGHDSAGVFACDRCHEAIDRRLLDPVTLEEVVRGAQERMVIRLKVIAGSTTDRPWRVRAARWALEHIDERAKKKEQQT